MAQAPTAAPTMLDGAMPADDAVDTGAPTADAPDADAEQPDNVILTVCKEADGTYTLIKGDEDEEGEESAGGPDANEQTFESVGALLKGILDLLNADKDSAGGEGSPDDQFNAGFDENAPPKPASPIPQKY